MDADSVDSFIVEMRSLINTKHAFLNGILNKIGWKIEDLETLVKDQPVKMVNCPINSEHRMPYESLLKHVTNCEKKQGSFPFEPGLVSPTTYNRLIRPVENGDDNQCSIKNESFYMDVKDNKTSGRDTNPSNQLMELLAAERDAKRRRAAHRGKRVHTNRKTYSEIIHEVIGSQMETLTENASTDVPLEDKNNSKIDIVDENKTNGDRYIDVGSSYFDENPYKRWRTIERAEEKLLQKIQVSKSKSKSPKNQYIEHRHKYSKRDYKSDRNMDRKSNDKKEYIHTSQRSYHSSDLSKQKSQSPSKYESHPKLSHKSSHHRHHHHHHHHRHSDKKYSHKSSTSHNHSRKKDNFDPEEKLISYPVYHKNQHKHKTSKLSSRDSFSDDA